MCTSKEYQAERTQCSQYRSHVHHRSRVREWEHALAKKSEAGSYRISASNLMLECSPPGTHSLQARCRLSSTACIGSTLFRTHDCHQHTVLALVRAWAQLGHSWAHTQEPASLVAQELVSEALLRLDNRTRNPAMHCSTQASRTTCTAAPTLLSCTSCPALLLLLLGYQSCCCYWGTSLAAAIGCRSWRWRSWRWDTHRVGIKRPDLSSLGQREKFLAERRRNRNKNKPHR